MPAAQRTRVVLPLPLGPRTAVTVPGGTEKLRSLNTQFCGRIAKSDPVAAQAPSQILSRFRRNSTKNTGAPIRAVRTPSGISPAVAVRAMVSMAIR